MPTTKGTRGEMNVNLTWHIHTIDATGMDALLTEHARTFQRHAALWARRENAVGGVAGAASSVHYLSTPRDDTIRV